MARSRCACMLLLAALVAAAGCNCEGTALEPLAPLIVPSSTSLDLGEVVVGTERERVLTLTSAGGAPVTLSGVTVDGEGFGLATAVAEVRLAPGETLELPVRFSPARTGFVSGLLTASSDASNTPSLAVTLQAVAVDPPACDDDNQCTVDTFDLELEACLFEPIEGDCSDPCLQEATCLNGSCVGTARTCPLPASACKIALCESGVGCVELDDPDACDDEDPCTIDSCDEQDGCRHVVASTGTPCGPIDGCSSAPICVSGVCTDFPVPDDVPCTDGDLCTTGDRCQAGACVGTGALLNDPAVTSTLPFGSVVEWTEVGPHLVGATYTDGTRYDLFLATADDDDDRLTLLDQHTLPLSYGVNTTLFALGDEGVVAISDGVQGGQVMVFMSVTDDAFGAPVALDSPAGVFFNIGGVAQTASATYVCLVRDIGLGAVWRLTMSGTTPVATDTDTPCERLVDDGTGNTAILTEGLDMRRVTLGPSIATLLEKFLPTFDLMSIGMMARGPTVIFDASFSDLVLGVDMATGTSFDLSVFGRPKALNDDGLWVSNAGELQLWSIDDVEAPVMQNSVPEPALIRETFGLMTLGERYVTSGFRAGRRQPGTLNIEVLTHPQLAGPSQLGVEGTGVLAFGARGAASITVSDEGELDAVAGGQAPAFWHGALLHRGPAGLGPVWLVDQYSIGTPLEVSAGTQLNLQQPSAPFVTGTYIVGAPLSFTGQELFLKGDGRHLVGVLEDADFAQSEVTVFVVDALDVDPAGSPATLAAVDLQTTALSDDDQIDQVFNDGFDLRLDPDSQTFGTSGSLELIDPADPEAGDIAGAYLILGRYGQDGIDLAPVLIEVGRPSGLAVGDDAAVVLLKTESPSGDELRLLRVDRVDDQLIASPVALGTTLDADNPPVLLLWDGRHLLVSTGDALRWYDVEPSGAASLTGTMPFSDIRDVKVAGDTLLVLEEGQLNAVQPPCPAP